MSKHETLNKTSIEYTVAPKNSSNPITAVPLLQGGINVHLLLEKCVGQQNLPPKRSYSTS